MNEDASAPLRLLFIGDVIGRSGRAAVLARLPQLREAWKLDFVIVNGENAAGGFGITEAICDELLQAGADCVTLGNHAFDQREALVFIERQPRLLRPVNYPPGTPGRGANLYTAARGQQVLVVNVQGRVFMDQLDDPFAAIERELAACPIGLVSDAIMIDMHAETTSEKMAMAHFVDGRASLVAGTHTHVPTADSQILLHGTGYISDAGMTGDYRFGDRHGQGRTLAPLHAQDARGAVRARPGRSDPVRRRGRDRRRRAIAKNRSGAAGRETVAGVARVLGWAVNNVDRPVAAPAASGLTAVLGRAFKMSGTLSTWLKMARVALFDRFDAEFYGHFHRDLRGVTNRMSLLRHYAEHGAAEGRVINLEQAQLNASKKFPPLPGDFDLSNYMNLNKDLRGSLSSTGSICSIMWSSAGAKDAYTRFPTRLHPGRSATSNDICVEKRRGGHSPSHYPPCKNSGAGTRLRVQGHVARAQLAIL